VDKCSFRYFFRQYVRELAEHLFEYDEFEPGLPAAERTLKAYDMAQRIALDHTKE